VSGENGAERRTATITVLFCDLVASTERHQLHGDDAADEFRREFFGILHRAVEGANGDLVKNTGDGVMVVFRDSAVDAVTCATVMHRDIEARDRYPFVTSRTPPEALEDHGVAYVASCSWRRNAASPASAHPTGGSRSPDSCSRSAQRCS
jgi:hypothetical protein